MSRKRNPDVTDQQIIDCYKRLMSSNKAARELDVTERRVCLTLRRHKIPRTGLEHYRSASQAYEQSVQQEILRLHNEGMSQEDLRKKFGGSSASIAMAIIRQGGVMKPGVTSRQYVSEEVAGRMCDLYRSGKSQDDIADEVGFSQGVVSRVLRERGIAMRSGVAEGCSHPRWNGGRQIRPDGYVYVMVAPDEEFAEMRNRQGYVMEHRLVMARKLGRPLSRSETVHHIDGDRSNNSPDNLQLRQGKHGKHVVIQCLDCGSHNLGPAPIAEHLDA